MHNYEFDGTSWKANIIKSLRYMLFNVQPSNIKYIGNRKHGFWYTALTPHFSISLLLAIIIHIIFLFKPASTNLMAYSHKTYGCMLFTLLARSSMFYKFCFITHLRVTATSFIISAHLDNQKAIKICTKQPFKECLLHYQLTKPS